MRILNETDAFMEAKERYRFEGTKRYDIEKLDAFLDGFEFADKQIKPMFLLFVRWCMDGYYTMSESDVWIPNDYGLSKDSVNWKTTEELFELWLEEQTKK